MSKMAIRMSGKISVGGYMNKQSPLHEAANSGNVQVVRKRIPARADPNSREEYGVTPPIFAKTFNGPFTYLPEVFNDIPMVGMDEVSSTKREEDEPRTNDTATVPADILGRGPVRRSRSVTLPYRGQLMGRPVRFGSARVDLQVREHDEPRTNDTATVPVEILRRGPDALAAYHKALKLGRTHDRRVPVMIVGQDRSGKTSLKKSLKGEKFDPHEDSTDGIEVDPSLFLSTTNVWRAKASGECLDYAKPLEVKIADATVREMRKFLSGESSNIDEEDENVISGGELQSDRGASFDVRRTRSADSQSSDASSGAEADVSVQNEKSTFLKTNSANARSSPERDKGDVSLFSRGTPANTSVTLGTNSEEIDSVPRELMHRALSEEEADETDDDIELVLWDFAGQSVFYTTHVLFLSRIAIYILTHDLTQKLEDKAVPLVKRGIYEDNITDDKCEMTNMDYIHYWLSSIHAFGLHSEPRSPDSKHLPPNLPPVFLVGTHADKCRGPRKVAMKIFQDLEGKVYEKHVLTKVFVVDNTKSGSETEDGEIKQVRAAVLQAARELPDVKKLFPVKWLQLEKNLEEERAGGVTLITLDAVREKVQVLCDAEEENDFRTVINFLHDRHALLHFSAPPELDKLVVLDRQWLIDVFKRVITVQPIDCQDPAFKEEWRVLEREGILQLELVKHQWADLIPSEETVSSLLLLLEKFSLTCRWTQTDGSKVYLVPSMLKSEADSKILNLISSAEVPALVVRFHDQYLPFGVFSRLVIRCVIWCADTWSARKQPKLYRNYARFFLGKDGSYQVVLAAKLSSVFVSVVGGKTGGRDADHERKLASFCHAMFAFVENAFREMQEEHLWMRLMSYSLCFVCPVCSTGGVRLGDCDVHDVADCTRDQCLHYITTDELVSQDSLVCTKSDDPSNTSICKEQYKPWLQASDVEVEQEANEKSGRGPQVDVPTMKLLNDLSREIIPEWQSLARRLGVDQGRIHNITFDNVSYPSPQQKAFEALRSWRDKGSSSTLRQLAQALRDEDLGRLAEQYCNQEVSISSSSTHS